MADPSCPSNRNPLWSESIATGNERFIKDIHQRLSGKAQGRSVISHNGATALKEPQAPYSAFFADQKGLLTQENAYFLSINY